MADLDCPDATPDDGTWTCPWDLSSALDGTVYSLSARATDRWGNRSEWMLDHPVIVDGRGPTVRLSLESLAALTDDLLTLDDIVLDGEVDDDRQATGIELCASAVGASADSLSLSITTLIRGPHRLAPGGPALPSMVLAMAHVRRSGSLVAIRLAIPRCRSRARSGLTSSPLRSPWLPIEVGTVLGLPTEILAGTISDGYAVDRLEPDSRCPVARQALVLTESGGAWSFTREFHVAGEYSLSLDAWDIAGNQRHLGPFLFTVLGGDLVADTSAVGTPATDPAITGRPFVYTTTIANSGPASATSTQLQMVAPDGTLISSASGASCTVVDRGQLQSWRCPCQRLAMSCWLSTFR